MIDEPPAQRSGIFSIDFLRRRSGDLILFGVTAVEMWLLLREIKEFKLIDWVYVLANVYVLVIALTRRAPQQQDRSIAAAIAVIVSYGYPYAQVIVLKRTAGFEVSHNVGLVLVIAGACGSLTSLLALGRFFGVRPALRGLVTRGPYRIVRNPIYVSYMIADIGYNLQEWSYITLILVAAGWASMIYRIFAEERMLSGDPSWSDYAGRVRYRLLPGIW